MIAMTHAQYRTLHDLAWYPETWWHDLPAGTREVLWERGWIREVRAMGCNTRGHTHPGYVAISAEGLTALTQREQWRAGKEAS